MRKALEYGLPWNQLIRKVLEKKAVWEGGSEDMAGLHLYCCCGSVRRSLGAAGGETLLKYFMSYIKQLHWLFFFFFFFQIVPSVAYFSIWNMSPVQVDHKECDGFQKRENEKVKINDILQDTSEEASAAKLVTQFNWISLQFLLISGTY